MRDVCAGFPEFPVPLIGRPHYLATIDTMLDGPTQIVVLEGEEGIGKTLLAAQFAEAKGDRAFSLFVSNVSSFSRSPEYLLAVLCDQIHWALHGVRMPADLNPEVFIRSARLQLQRQAVAGGSPYYFIVDGLLEAAHDDPELVALVLTDYLPTGRIPGFKFLATGAVDQLPDNLRKLARGWTPPGFSPDEVAQVLEEFKISPQVLSVLRSTFGGVPGKIASVRRILSSGITPAQLEADLPSTLCELLAVEWRSVDNSDLVQLKVLAALAHAEHRLTISDLSRLAGVDATRVRGAAQRLQFLRIDSDTDVVSFASTAFQQFASTQLRDKKSETITAFVELLLEDATSPTAVEVLPAYLESLGRQKDILLYLSQDHLGALCERTHSLQPVVWTLKRGFDAAVRTNEPVVAYQLALQRGLLVDLGNGSALASEVNARLTLGEDDAALSLAQGALLKEDRLEALAVIAHRVLERGEKVDPSLLTEIRNLADAVDYAATPNRAVSVASNLIGAIPEVAIALVEQATNEGSNYPTDVAYAALSLAAQDLARAKAEGGVSDEAISNRIKNPNIRSLTRTLSSVVSGYSVEELLRRCEDMSSTRDCVYLLERWTVANTEHPDAYKVISYGLGRMLRTTDFTLDCRTLRHLASPLPACASDEPFATNQVLQTIDAQMAMLEKNGPSVEFARLCILLAETEATWSPEPALARVERACYFAATLDVDLRCEALAWIISRIKKDRYSRLGHVASTLLQTLCGDLDRSVDELLLGTAEHFEALRRIVRAIVRSDTDLLMSIIAKTNTQDRRDALVVESVSRLSVDELRVAGVHFIQSAVSMIANTTVRDQVVCDMMRALNDPEFRSLDQPWLGLLKRSLNIERAPWKSVACTQAEAICARQDNTVFHEAIDLFVKGADAAVRAINSDWDRTDIAFSMASVANPADTTRIRSFVELAHKTRKASLIPDGRTAASYMEAIRLACRAFVGLLPRQLDVDECYARLRQIVNDVPSEGERVRLWSELAIRCFGAAQTEFGTKIINDEVRPIIANITDPGFRAFVLAEVAPALYSAHSVSAIRDLKKLDPVHRDEAFENVCRYLFTRQPLYEPVRSTRQCEKLTDTDVDDVLECLRHIESDVILANLVETLSAHLVSADGVNEFSKAQRADIARRIREVTHGRLPWKFGIAHEGYVLLIEAFASELESVGIDRWRVLLARAEALPNTADRVLVLGMLADHTPKKFAEFRSDLIGKAQIAARLIPAPLDRLSRLGHLASIAADFDVGLAKRCLEEAFRLSLDTKHDLIAQQRRMIDLADRIDPEFAKSLLGQLETDPAVSRRRALQQRHQLNRILKKLPKELPVDVVGDLSGDATVELCHMMLCGLHDGSVAYLSADRMPALVARASGLPFRHACTIFAWAIENSVACHSNTPYGTTHLVGLFKACAAACELGLQVMSKAAGYAATIADVASAAAGAKTSQPIEPGERGKAIDFLRSWLERVHPQELRICDPYFSPPDLDILRLVLEIIPSCTVKILAGEQKQRELGLTPPYDEVYQQHWRSISQHDPPATDLVIAGLGKTGDCPVHDRWILGGGRGIKLGISFSGLGRSRLSELSELDEVTAAEHAKVLDRYFQLRVREVQGERIRYFSCSV